MNNIYAGHNSIHFIGTIDELLNWLHRYPAELTLREFIHLHLH
jgi:hypothetical protein